jgi:hypothetical protein
MDTFVIAVWHEQQPEDLERSQPEHHPACVVRFSLTQPAHRTSFSRDVQKVPVAFAPFRTSL